MNAIDNHLERLLKAAADTPSLATPEPSFTRKARVLAHWRAAHAQPLWFDLVPVLRRGLAWACAVAAVVGVVSATQIKPATPDTWQFASTVASAAYGP